MRRILAAMLSAALILGLVSGCQQPAANSEPSVGAEWLKASDVADEMLSGSGFDGDEQALERLSQEADGAEFLTAYLENAYGLTTGQWEDAAVIRGVGASAFELAVLRLEDGDAATQAATELEAYLLHREGDFAGYAPDQANMAANGGTAQSGPYVGLFICPAPEQAESAFRAAVSGDTPPKSTEAATQQPVESPEATPQPSESPEATQQLCGLPKATQRPAAEPETSPDVLPEPSQENTAPKAAQSYPGRVDFVPPNEEDMSLYDTSAIREAWKKGDPAGLSDYDSDIYHAAQEVLNQVLEPGMSDLKKETALYNWMVNNVNYDWTHQDVMVATPRESFTPYGGLVNRTAVCLGYATSFQLLCDLTGLECIIVVGAADNSQGDHGWNMVRIDGNWYCLDATWDSCYRQWGYISGKEQDWMYFNITSESMANSDHQWDYANTPEAVTQR